MLYFATLFDRNYISRGLALLDSLTRKSVGEFHLYILALDHQVDEYFKELKSINIKIIRLEEIELFYPELAAAKKNRSLVEYYFTLSPYLPSFIMATQPEVDRITTMDADLYFFEDPSIILNEYPKASVLITPHNFSDNQQHLIIYGKYNVSFQSFKRDENAIACLLNWRQKCLEWCYDRHDQEHKRFADQQYLDSWSAQFEGVESIMLAGAGLAPWNLRRYHFGQKGNKILVDGHPLIYFHFHGLRTFGNNFAFHGLEAYSAPTWIKAIKYIYFTYLTALKRATVKTASNEKAIIRNNAGTGKSFSQMLNHPEGYWFYNDNIITHINLYRWANKLTQSFKKIWQRS